jgi:tetratricopeptide (TPR) repeat protein
MEWFEPGLALNRYDYEAWLGCGMCLDWLDRPKEATKYFVQALALFPSSAEVEWKFAWHCSILRNYPLAKLWLERSLAVAPSPEARAYLEMVKERMAGSAPGGPAGP